MPDLRLLDPLTDVLEQQAQLVGEGEADCARVVNTICRQAKGRKFILIGEATHGTAEFYRIRAEVSRHLIVEEGFDAIAVEADWPDAYRVNRFVGGRSDDADASAALSGFERFPTWMWRNEEIHAFISWLREHNEGSRHGHHREPVGFYGLDLYSMTTSMQAVFAYLDRIDPEEAAAARQRYGCFGQFIANPQAYGYAIASGRWDSCEQEVLAQFMQLQRKARLYVEKDGACAGNEFFSAQQNAELVRNAEEYYRAMFRGRPSTWNLRDQHMFKTLEKLAAHLETGFKREARIIVWAHNSHLGNAAATEMSRCGETNMGQLVTENYGDRVLRVGFSTSRGSVTAASNWDGPAETMTIRPPLPGSYEELFSTLEKERFFIDLRAENDVITALRVERLQRAIGVIYRPETERMSHYFLASLPLQFDLMIHLEETHALRPLPAQAHRRPGEMDETYPSGL